MLTVHTPEREFLRKMMHVTSDIETLRFVPSRELFKMSNKEARVLLDNISIPNVIRKYYLVERLVLKKMKKLVDKIFFGFAKASLASKNVEERSIVSATFLRLID